MKKSKLIAGVLLMILGTGMSIGSVALRHSDQGRCGMINPRHNIINGNVGPGEFRIRPFNKLPNQNQKQYPGTNPRPNPNQNNGQNGGAKQ